MARRSSPQPKEKGRSKIITLLSDFGDEDGYVASMKGVILSLNPRAQIVDISHSIPSHQVVEGGFILKTVYPFFPKGTIHLAVIDPGVGGERKPIIVETDHSLFVGPDNGLFSFIYEENPSRVWEIRDVGAIPAKGEARLSAKRRARQRRNELPLRKERSDTFHGRDIFAPVAASLSLGVKISKLGRLNKDFVRLPIPKPVLEKEGILGHILRIDKFGNLITNVSKRFLKNQLFEISTKEGETLARVERISHSYLEGERGKIIALVGSAGLLEFSVNQGRANEFLPLRVGDPFVIRFRDSRG